MADAKLGVIRARAKGGLLDARRPVCREPEALRLCGVVRCRLQHCSSARVYDASATMANRQRRCVHPSPNAASMRPLPESVPFPRRVRVGFLQV